MKSYGPVVRKAALRRILPPNSQPIARVARKMRISPQTLIIWKKKVAQALPMEEAEPENEKFSSEGKFKIVLETSKMNEIELGEYASSKGINVEEISQWRDACRKANGEVAKEILRLNTIIKQQQHQLQAIQNDLRLKEKKLAEIAALQVLKKKAAEIWGEAGGD